MKKTLDFFKFTVSQKDMKRVFLQGFYCDNSYKVATDAKILVMAKADYPAEWENQIVAKDNSFIEEHFPVYKRVIPFLNTKYPWGKYKEVDTKELLKIKKALTETKDIYSVHKKLLSTSEREANGGVCVAFENSVFSKVIIEKVLHFLECYPDSKFYVNTEKLCAAYLLQGTPDNIEAACVFMPMQYCIDDLTDLCLKTKGLFFTKEIHSNDNEDYILKTYFKKVFERKNSNSLTEKDRKDIENVKKYLSVMSA